MHSLKAHAMDQRFAWAYLCVLSILEQSLVEMGMPHHSRFQIPLSVSDKEQNLSLPVCPLFLQAFLSMNIRLSHSLSVNNDVKL